ncbi:P-loop NTPase [Marinospirillum minutulum]|uniref:P-loop NTPase n=1 Tax=Marinospirillum minutulum TaxID=64974 RepID=UPI00040D4C47|nr:P-loop NTPase [Marinospirillum minutulum]
MQIKHINIDETKNLSDQPACGLGHACQFCPKDPDCTLDKSRHEKLLIEARLASIDQIILVMANKGGVGKSTISANLAAGLAAQGYRVGVADADIHGPNQSRFFGFVGSHIKVTQKGLATCNFQNPAIKQPIKVGSLAFLMESDETPIVWRDSYKHDFMHHLIGSFNWEELDYLIVDMPPGTGNELITLSDMLETANTSAILVTSPQEIALMDSLKALRFCQDRQMPILGVVENMSGITCPHCSGEFHLFPNGGLTEKLNAVGIKSLTQIPLDPHLASGSDEGLPDLLKRPTSAVAVAFAPVIDACIQHASKHFAETAVESINEALESNLLSPELEASLEGMPSEEREAVRHALAQLLGAEQKRLATSSGEDK